MSKDATQAGAMKDAIEDVVESLESLKALLQNLEDFKKTWKELEARLDKSYPSAEELAERDGQRANGKPCDTAPPFVTREDWTALWEAFNEDSYNAVSDLKDMSETVGTLIENIQDLKDVSDDGGEEELDRRLMLEDYPEAVDALLAAVDSRITDAQALADSREPIPLAIAQLRERNRNYWDTFNGRLRGASAGWKLKGAA